MTLDSLLNLVPMFVLVFFRVAGMMLAAPLFGGARIPQRIKLMLALVLALGMTNGVALPPSLPLSTWLLAVCIAGEMLFGLAIGTALSFVFVAVHWAGEIIGQQLGLGIGQIYDPQMGQSGSVISDFYYLLTLVIFLIVGGHRAFLRGVHDSFASLPLLSIGMTQDLLDLVVGLLQSATALALQLAAPVLLTMLVVDIVLGFIGKTIPQINVMAAALSLRSMLGLVVLILGLVLTSQVIRDSMLDAMRQLAGALLPPAA